MPSKHEVRISYSTLTEESAAECDHADHGWIDGEYETRHSLNDGDREVTLAMSRSGDFDWPSLRDAMRFMAEKCPRIETDWTPDIGTGRGFGGCWFSGTGCTEDCEGDEIGVSYDLHIDNVSDGTAMRLARLMANNGVYFANVRTLRRRKQRVTHWSYGSGSSGCLYDSGPEYADTKEQAIEGALFIFDHLPEAELELARRNLAGQQIHYFTRELRADAGADYVEITQQEGPCPEANE